ncbi:MAG: hypothetical protein H0T91_08600 [Propionibacteriaceae bacterium]|nr:hypothetical protein [Propionibacteriaceae bacterium]
MSAPSPLSRPARRLDMSALTQPLDEPALTAFIADSKATGKPWRQITTGLPRPGVSDIIGQLIPVVIPLAGLLFLLYTGGTSLVEAVWRFTLDAPFPLNLVIVGFVALILLGVVAASVRAVMVIRSLIIPRWWWEAAYRITGFAAANNLRYGHDEVVSYPGVIFGTGSDRTAERRLTTTAGRRVEIGNYRYTIRAEHQENSKVYGWGYVAIALDRRLPHLLLDARANDRSVLGIKTSNLPIELARDQRLSLGGEFDDKFSLYAPSDYGRDAFYIFAPDLMALFVDRLGTFDVEIIDDTMFVYGSRFDLLDLRTYDWLQELVDTVVARTVRRTERYSDHFALLETDPAPRRSTGEAAAAVEEPAPTSSDNKLFQLLPGSTLGAAQRPESPTVPPGTHNNEEPVFTLGGDGPPRTATNTIAGRGRRLRRRRWGLWSIVALLMIGFWIYNEFVAPIFGLPTLDR